MGSRLEELWFVNGPEHLDRSLMDAQDAIDLITVISTGETGSASSKGPTAFSINGNGMPWCVSVKDGG